MSVEIRRFKLEGKRIDIQFKRTLKAEDGSSFAGEIECSFDTIVSLFGEPQDSIDTKTKAEWNFIFDNVQFSIYDYKSGKEKEDNTEWHIGSRKMFANSKLSILKQIISEFEQNSQFERIEFYES
jgi:hypothetical protein